MKTKRIIAVTATIAIGLAFAVFAWIWIAPCSLGGCAPLDDLARYQAEGSELLDTDGEAFARLATVNRRIVSLDSLPAHVPQAFVAIEDQRFYRHDGLDLWRTAGALVRNLRSGQVAEGGSTITQQLARNLFPEWLPYRERNVRRKVLEARVARQLERSFTKDKILELYLNHIYLGSGAYGIEAAALTYFGKPASELDLMEAATIAGLPQAPSHINPKESVERATRRRDLVLEEMVRAGYITSTDADEARAEPIVVTDGGSRQEGPTSSYFVELVRRELEETVGARFYTAGLRIHTTLDLTAQAAAEEEIARQLDAIERGAFGVYRHPTFAAKGARNGGSDYLQGAVIVMDAATGEVRALVGGRDFTDSKFDRATQALRQPGSAFKPFIYAAALERYRSPTHQIEDSPLRLTLSGGRVWEPRNYTPGYDGLMTMREALTRSKNIPSVRLAQEVGLGSVIRMARSLGITSDIPDVPATALGAADVRLIELVTAYAAFANGGERVRPHLIRRIVDRNGYVLWEAQPRSERVLDPAVAFVLTSILRDVVDRGTGSAVRAVGFQGPAAGKTGTTNDASDVWFVGYTPELVAGVWIGLDQPATIVRGASGGTLAAPVWGRIMRRMSSSLDNRGAWRAPSSVLTAEVERATGAIVNPACPAQGPTYTEYFIRSLPPQTFCPRYDYDLEMAVGDTGWIDEEWGDFDFGYPRDDTIFAPGVDWPELEALRRRIERAERDLELDRQFPEDGRTEPPATIGSPTDRDPEAGADPPPISPRDTADAEPDTPRPDPPVLGEPAAPRPQGAGSQP